MNNSYTQIYIQYVFAVNGRANLLNKVWRSELFKYMAGIIREKDQKVIAIGGTSDHVHAFVGLKPTMVISDLIRDLKNNSTNYINRHQLVLGKFQWQEGYGAFSYSHSQIEKVYYYILNQEEHHRLKTFKEEYIDLLKEFSITYNDVYLFDWVEE